MRRFRLAPLGTLQQCLCSFEVVGVGAVDNDVVLRRELREKGPILHGTNDDIDVGGNLLEAIRLLLVSDQNGDRSIGGFIKNLPIQRRALTRWVLTFCSTVPPMYPVAPRRSMFLVDADMMFKRWMFRCDAHERSYRGRWQSPPG